MKNDNETLDELLSKLDDTQEPIACKPSKPIKVNVEPTEQTQAIAISEKKEFVPMTQKTIFKEHSFYMFPYEYEIILMNSGFTHKTEQLFRFIYSQTIGMKNKKTGKRIETSKIPFKKIQRFIDITDRHINTCLNTLSKAGIITRDTKNSMITFHMDYTRWKFDNDAVSKAINYFTGK